jgi:hypothetical protein
MTEPHPSLDVLADLLVGEGAEADVAHLSGCAACAGRLAELDAAQAPVVAALAGLPAPAPLDGLSDRLTAALAAAGPLPAVEPEGRGLTALPPPDEREELAPPAPPPTQPQDAPATRTVTPLDGARRTRRTWLPAAAAAVLVLSAAGLGLSALSGGGSTDEAPSAVSDSAAGAAASPGSASAGLVRNDTGTDYAASPDALTQQLPALLSGRAAAAPPPAAEQAAPTQGGPEGATDERDTTEMSLSGAPLERLRDPAELDACLSALVPRTARCGRSRSTSRRTPGSPRSRWCCRPRTPPSSTSTWSAPAARPATTARCSSPASTGPRRAAAGRPQRRRAFGGTVHRNAPTSAQA